MIDQITENVEKLSRDFETEMLFTVLRPFMELAYEAGKGRVEFESFYEDLKNTSKKTEEPVEERGSKFAQRLAEAMQANKRAKCSK